MLNKILTAIFGVLMTAAALPLGANSVTQKIFFPVTAEERRKLDERDPVYLFIERDKEHSLPAFPIKLTDKMIQLLTLDDLYDEKDSFFEVVTKTQKKWLATVQGTGMQATAPAKANTERTDLKDSCEQAAMQEKVEKVARSMGLFDARSPAFSEYKYGAWLGAFLQGVRNNLHNLVKAWEAGCRFEKLVVFTGERYLRKGDGEEDDIKKLCDPKLSALPFKEGWHLPKDALYDTEYDMMQLVFDQVQLPKDMAEKLQGKVEFVNAPKGQHVRPGTKDCYVTWLKTNPEEGTVLAVSYPLLWVAQQIAGETILGDRYPLDTIAPALSAEEYEKRKHAVVTLVHDTVTKCLYEINNQLKDKEKETESKIISFPMSQ